ncbi:TIR domain-containing protein [Streptomyces murinus]|uniref:toll/interleukin-1 receptor domain-containing protein n=1 Tax=Streptomyces murinus TaxID=33900 RepID=UPI002E821642|nr:TIR domain-containing protein [Streptomyces murinus]WUD07274.1 TIR domain-containing protein [Streptomyces murinus]
MPDTREPWYDVALSFAGEDRDYVQVVAQTLRDSGLRVFYDDYEQVALWGKDLYSHLDRVYREQSKYCVLFISQHYAKKVWTSHERRSAQARAIEERKEYVLPARFDDTPIDGLPSTIGYLDISDTAPGELARMIMDKVGPRYSKPGFPKVVDRLWEELGVEESDAKEKDRVRRVAYGFYDALRHMTIDERKAVVGVLAFGCPAELPEGVHISLDLLSRMIGQETTEVLQNLAAVRSLNVKVKARKGQFHADDDELVVDDKDLLLHFWCPVPDSQDCTAIAYGAVACAADHFCVDHGIEVVAKLDFSRLDARVVGLAARAED